MRVWAVALSLLAFFLTLSGAAVAGPRVALVIGNGTYRTMAPRDNAPGDAKAMAALLRTVGFEVIEATDLTHDQMVARFNEFGQKAGGAEIALFYYAGQAVALNGENYLLPIDSDFKSEMDVKLKAIDARASVSHVMSGARVRLMFYDASRDNPFAAGRQQEPSRAVITAPAEIRPPEGGTLVAFASAPGQSAEEGPKGGHSPFTQALLDHIAAPGVEIQQAMTEVRAEVNDLTKKRQMAWGNTDLLGYLYLNPQPTPAAPK